MMRSVMRLGVIGMVLWASATVMWAEGNWPTWRGVDMTGVAADADPPVEFSESKNLAWKVAIPGGGNGTPVVWGEKMFLQSAVRTGRTGTPPAKPPEITGFMRSRFGTSRSNHVYQFNVVCLNRLTGKVLWQKTVREAVPHEGHHRDHGYASFSPVTDGKHVWVSFGSRGVHCLDTDGKLIWSKDLGLMYTRNSFGEGSSPALAGQALLVLMDQEGPSYLTALDRDTGRELWRKKRDEKSSWTTPLVVTAGGRMQAIVNGSNRTRSYDVKTGEVIWECGGQTQNVIPAPVTGFGMVYCASGFRGNTMQAIELGRTGDLTGSKAVRWSWDTACPYVPSPLLVGRRLYFFTTNTASLSCADAKTGKAHYQRQRLPDMRGVYASPIGAAGRVYLPGRRGTVTVIKDSDKLEILATNKLDDGFDASPVAIGKRLYLRGKKYLYCLARP